MIRSLVALAVLCWASSVRAEDETVRFLFDSAGIEGCPEAGDLQDRIAARLGYLPFSEDAPGALTILILAPDHARLMLRPGEGEPRVDEARGPGGCATLVGPLIERSAALLGLDDSAAALAPDVIVFNDGSRAEGTITRLLPDEEVELEIRGRRSSFAMATVRYAGPREGEEAALAARRARDAELRPSSVYFTLEDPPDDAEVSIVRVTASGTGMGQAGRRRIHLQMTEYAPVCAPPCYVDLVRGRHTLGVKIGDADPLIETNVDLSFDARVSVSVVRRGWMRAIGIGMLVGIAPLAALPAFVLSEQDEDTASLAVGFTMGISLAIGGLVLLNMPDSARFEPLPIEEVARAP